jgi:hypothetical protein
MLGKLIKLLILSRYTKPLLALNVIILLLDYTSMEGLHDAPHIPKTFTEEAIFMLTFPVIISALASRVVISKSDMDFLFTLPLDRKEIFTGIYIASIFATGIFSLYFGIFAVAILGTIGIIIPILLAIMSTSMSITFSSIRGLYRGLIGAILTIWFVSPYFGFPFSPLSMIIGYYYGYPILVALTLVFVYSSIRNFDNIKFKTFQGNNKPIKDLISFEGSTPFTATLKRNLSFIELGGRFNFAGTPIYKTARIKLYYIIIASTIISIIYYFIVRMIGFFSVSFYLVIVEYILILQLAQTAFMYEPLWLGLGIINPLQYVRYYLGSKSIAAFLMLLPFGIVNFILGVYSLGLVTIIGIPLSMIYLASIIARLNPIQIKDENAPNVRFTAMQWLLGLFTFPILIIVMITAFFPSIIYGIIADAILAAISLPFIFYQGFWDKVKDKMIEMGFV